MTLICLLVLLYGHFDHATAITVEFTLKKQYQTIHNTYVFAGITIYGHSDHATAITVEFALKNNFRPYITVMCLLVLPYMVTPITQ